MHSRIPVRLDAPRGLSTTVEATSALGSETSPSGREINKILVSQSGVSEAISADIVVVSAGAVNSAALLLRSADDRHLHGLANRSGVVGRHYMGHTNSILLAVSKCPNPTIFQKTLAVNDFYLGSPEFPYPMGHISFVGKLDRHALRGGAPAIAPGFALEIMSSHSLDFWLTSEDLPDPDNRVTLDRDGKIVLSYKPNNEEGRKRLHAKLKELMKQQIACPIHGHGCHQGLFARNLFVGDRIPLAGVAHQNGTIRSGRDPKTSALDVNCKAHELDNLYVVDGSFFPSSAAVNSRSDDHGQRAAGWRSPDRKDEVSPCRAGACFRSYSSAPASRARIAAHWFPPSAQLE